MGMFVVSPASFHHNNHQHHEPIISDPHSINGSNPATALGVGVGVGVIPLLTTTPCLGPNMGGSVDDENGNGLSGRINRNNGIQFWQQNQQAHQAQHQNAAHLFKKTSIFDHGNNCSGPTLVQSSGGIFGSGSGSASSTVTCQDCGNQAKKDCSHGRCRTCCKSRGFDCVTHVKSTWVPAARRRERQLMGGGTSGGAGSTGSSSGAKKPRLVASQTTATSHNTSTSNTTPPRSFDTSSSHQDASFKESLPGQVRAPAVFKCVRVTALEDGEDHEYAYQAVVKINGHVFKGFLYDQGVETRDVFPNISELHLGGGGGGGRNINGASLSSPIIDPSDVYAASSGAGLLGAASSFGVAMDVR